jgi:oxygen-dependent protoporphyrinogen oxidase
VVRDLEAMSPVGEVPEAAAVVRWSRAMPQYEVGHLDRVAGIERALDRASGLFVTGSAYRGVGVADCVRQAHEAAERVRAHLGRAQVSDRVEA